MRLAYLYIFKTAEGPEVVCQVVVRDVVVRHREITLDAPVRAPRVADEYTLGGVVVTHGYHRVAPELFFAGLRQVQLAGLGNFLGLERLINRETEDERVTFGEALAHLLQTDDAMIRGNLMIGRLFVARGRRFLGELRNLVWPLLFTAHTKLDERFDAVANHRARVVIDRAFHRAFVVVNEQPAQIGDRVTGFLFKEFQVANQSVGRATAKLPLIFHRRTACAQIHLWRQFLRRRGDGSVEFVPIIGPVGHPPVPGIHFWFRHTISFGCWFVLNPKTELGSDRSPSDRLRFSG